MPLATLALAALLSAPGAAAPLPDAVATRGPLTGCRVNAVNLAMLGLSCPGDLRIVVDEQARRPREDAEGLARRMAEKRGLPLGTGPAPEALAGLGSGARRFTLGAPPEYILDGLWFEGAGGTGTGRSYTCVAEAHLAGEAGCRQVLTSLARDGLPEPYASLVRAPAAPTAAGRVFAAPAGCTLHHSTPTSGQLDCAGDVSLVWFTGDAAMVETVQDRLVTSTETSLGEGRWEEARPCRLEGTPTRCRHRVGRAQGVDLEAWLASAAVRDTHLVAWCLHPKADALAPACRALIDVTPGAR